MKPFHRAVRSVLLLGAIAALSLGSRAGVRGTTAPVMVEVREVARVTRDGELHIALRARCEPVGELLEAFVLVQQGSVSGMAGFGPICDGRTRTYRLQVQPLDGEFEPGPAHVSAFVLLCDEAGACEQGQDSREVRVRGPR
jgi:hypothetical protein